MISEDLVKKLTAEFGDLVRVCSDYHVKVGAHDIWIPDRGKVMKFRPRGMKKTKQYSDVLHLIDALKKCGQPKPPHQGTVFQPSSKQQVEVIFCCGCDREIKAELKTGREVYPHLPRLWRLPYWVCLACDNYVGCHHKTKAPTKPLGCIPTPEIRAARQAIHAIIDPLWRNGAGGFSRGGLYAELSQRLGYQFHSAEVRSVEEAEKIKTLAGQIAKEGRRNGLPT